jgi:predicted porin
LIGIGPTSSVIHDTETSVIYGAIVHRIVPRLFGTVRGTFQNSNYHGGGQGIDGQSDRFYEASVQLDYKFNPNFSVQAGYDYDRLDSSLSTAAVGPRKYDRNKFYIGATASY